MQPAHVWFPGHPPEPGSARAKASSWPGSRGTPKSTVFLQPGSLRAPARSRAWRFRARGNGAKILGLPPPFPPFTASIYLPSRRLPLFFFLSLPVCAAGKLHLLFLLPRVFLMDSWPPNAYPLSRFVAGAVDLRPLEASEFFPFSFSIFLCDLKP